MPAARTVPAWAARREIAADWAARLRAARVELGLDAVRLVRYAHVGRNNAELPERAWIDDVESSMTEVFRTHELLVALTEFSATAPLKLAARRFGFRAATMPGFSVDMVPALRLDYDEVDRRCRMLKARLDAADGARLALRASGRRYELDLDLRHRQATSSGGLIPTPGSAGNLPSGETYIVPYEGERPGDPSRTSGELPLELEGELLVYRIAGNRVREVVGTGPVAERERREIDEEPAYGNVAELGLGVLAAFGIRPVGEILLDEKLGLHVAFGRSDHFGGTVGPGDFRRADRVVHIDRVYLPELQPSVVVEAVELRRGDEVDPVMRDGQYV